MPARSPFSCVPPDPVGNAVDVAAHVLVGGFGPLQHEVEPRTALALEHERRLVHRLGAAFGDDLLDEVGQPFLVLEDLLRPLGLVLERDADALVDVADDLEPLANQRRVELDLRKDRRIGMEVDGGARCRAPRRPSSAGRSACRA